MLKIPDAIQIIIQENPLIQQGMSLKILNLTQLAKFIHPLIETRTKKEVQISAIVMNLSRISQKQEKISPDIQKFSIHKLSIFSNLVTMSFEKNSQTHSEINQIYEKKSTEDYFALSESTTEISIIFDKNMYENIKEKISQKPKYENDKVSAVAVKFSEDLFHIPGLLSLMMQKLTFQGINIIEISSTFTEFIFYLNDKDLRLAFDTLHRSFMQE